MIRTMIELWRRFWFEPIDPAPLALFRQAFAWSLLIYAVAWSRDAGEWLTAAGYHPPLALDPQNGPQLPLLPGAALPVVGVVFYASLLAYIFGYARKWVVWVLVAAASYSLFVDPISSFTINRLFVIGLIILALAPEPDWRPEGSQVGRGPGKSRSDFWGCVRGRDGHEPLNSPTWATRMLQLTVVGQYFASGLCKAVNGDWWGGEDVLFMQIQGLYMTDAAAWLVRTLPHWAWRVQQELALWFELLAPILFAVRRLRPLAFVLGLGLHLMVAVTMDQLIYFSLQMACFYLLFIPPEWARRLAPGRGEAASGA